MNWQLLTVQLEIYSEYSNTRGKKDRKFSRNYFDECSERRTKYVRKSVKPQTEIRGFVL